MHQSSRLAEGMTPLVPFDDGACEHYLKLDFISPTGSYKDRGASVLISKLKELGIRQVVEDSSGNAGAAIAAYRRESWNRLHHLLSRVHVEGKTRADRRLRSKFEANRGQPRGNYRGSA